MQLLDGLGRTIERVSEVVPECTGLSVARADHDAMFTIAVSDETTAVVDAVQYLDGGPGVDSVKRQRWGETRVAEADTRERWPLFAQACAGANLQSTLTVPVTESGLLVIGSVQLYAGVDLAFEGRDEDLAQVVGESAHDIVTGSETSLATRRMAEPAPRSLRGEGAVNRAIGSLAVHLGIDVAAAYTRLADAALRAGIAPDRLALALMDLRD